jgi:hypothetical protein
MTVSKAQRQTLKPIAIYLPLSVFPQDQLYVIINRSSSFDSISVENIEDYRQHMGAKGVVRGPKGAWLADNRVPTKLRKCHLFLPSPIQACPRHGPWATS